MSQTVTRPPLTDVAAIVKAWPARVGYNQHIADRWGVPIRTAHGWVSKARRAGLLPPGGHERPCRRCGGTGVVTWRTPEGRQ
jgi:hypothetical protein